MKTATNPDTAGHHQQYLAKNPGGYCNHGFCQVSYA
jgi:peptide-methionine (S)-S-oxide reductase